MTVSGRAMSGAAASRKEQRMQNDAIKQVVRQFNLT